MSDEKLLTSEGAFATVIDLGFGPKETKETGSCCCFCPKKKSPRRKSHREVKRSGWSNMQPTPADVGREDSSIAPSDSFFEIGHEQHRPSILRKFKVSPDLTMESFPEWQ